MAFFDFPPDKLKTYRGQAQEPRDFDDFWRATLDEAASHKLAARFVPVVEDIYDTVDVSDVTFNGFGGQPIKGWFIEPRNGRGVAGGKPSKLPCVVTYIGYGGGRSLPADHLHLAAAGLSNFVMDTRGQGSSWSPGDTPDEAWSGPAFSGVMTRGITNRDTYYYRRVFTDAVRAIEAAASHPRVDPKRVGVTGGSQGGGIALAAAGLAKLAGHDVKVCMPDVPFLCDYRRSVTIIDTLPYNEIAKYLAVHRHQSEKVFETLEYFDGVNFASRITARTLMSVALMDNICPPSTCFAAFNRIKARAKEVRVYDFNNHEGGGVFQATERMRFAKKWL
jgi:cephalosporin-C deacetylase